MFAAANAREDQTPYPRAVKVKDHHEMVLGVTNSRPQSLFCLESLSLSLSLSDVVLGLWHAHKQFQQGTKCV